jgi:hypothetical protein
VRLLAGILSELWGLFIDDGHLALNLLFVVALAALVERLLPGLPIGPGIILLIGCPAVLLVNVRRLLE